MKPFLVECPRPAGIVWRDGYFFLNYAGYSLFKRFHMVSLVWFKKGVTGEQPQRVTPPDFVPL